MTIKEITEIIIKQKLKVPQVQQEQLVHKVQEVQRGIQGLPGPNQILKSSLYTIIGPPSNTNSGSFINSIAQCGPGDSVVSGGNAMITPRTVPFAIFDQPLQTLDG